MIVNKKVKQVHITLEARMNLQGALETGMKSSLTGEFGQAIIAHHLVLRDRIVQEVHQILQRPAIKPLIASAEY